MRKTLASEFDLVCGEEWKVPLSQSVFFAGVLVGAALFGHLGDVWGRKNMFLLGLLEMSVCGIAAAFSTNFLMFTILQFFTAMGKVGVFQTVFVLGIEIVGKSKRVFCGIVIEYFFVLGEILLPGTLKIGGRSSLSVFSLAFSSSAITSFYLSQSDG